MVIGTVILVLLYLCGLALAFFLIEWVLQQIGLQLPAQVIAILKVMLVLVAIYIIVMNLVPLAPIRWSSTLLTMLA